MLDDKALVLVTGGAGFIGSHIAERLTGAGIRVRILDNFSTGSRENAAEVAARSRGLCQVVEGDIRSQVTVKAAMQGVTHVVHQAALASVPRSVADPLSSHEVNATGTLLLLDEARRAGVRRFLYAGSSSVYGDQPELPKRESMPTNPRSPYALGKLVGETYGTIFHSLFGLSTVTLRYFNVFGPRQRPDSQYAAVIPLFLRAVLTGDTPVIYGDGGQTRDFTYIENVVEANWLALGAADEKVGGRIMNVACGDRISLLQLLEIIGRLAGRAVQPRFEPPRAGDVRDSQAAVEEAERRLGYRPLVGLEDGLGRTLEWFRGNAAGGSGGSVD
jgi:nucleoside-diphosphate-sugar epimerase